MSLPQKLIPTGFEGIAYLSEGLINVRFKFSKRRFAAIAAIKGSKYNKELKVWQVPISVLPNLQKSRYFQADQIFFSFDSDEWQQAASSFSAEQKAALNKIAQDPFMVSEQDIQTAQPEVVFRKDAAERILMQLQTSNNFADKLIKEAQAIYLKTARAYFVPTHNLTNFVKYLRDHKHSFAVEASAGEFLKKTAAFRLKLINHPELATANDLARVSLMPFFSQAYGEGGVFKLNFWTAEHLKLIWPEVASFSARKKLADRCHTDQLLRAMFQAELENIKLWLSSEAQASLEAERPGLLRKLHSAQILEDQYLVVAPQAAVWLVGINKQPGLLVTNEWLASVHNQQLVTTLKMEPANIFGANIWLTGQDFQVWDCFQQINSQAETSSEAQPARPKVARSFDLWAKQFSGSQKDLLQIKRYKAMLDCELKTENQVLAAKLFPHQRVAVSWLLENKVAFLGDDMGLGKTLSVLATFEELKHRDEVDFLLLIAPASLLRNWLREQQQWTPKLKFCACPESKKDREALLGKVARDRNNIYDGLVINYESARIAKSVELLQAIATSRRVLLCLDESQRVKNPRSVGFKSLAQIAPLCARRILLSGTPTPKDITDIWSQYFLLDGGARFGKNFFEWLSEIAVLGNRWSEFAVKSFKPEAIKKVIDRTQEILLRRKKEDVVNLPEKIYSIRDVILKGDQEKRYEELRQDLLIKITKTSGAEFYREISGILEEYLRAVQIASNPRLVDPNWQGEPAKFLELDEIVTELVAEQGKKIVIWTNFLKNVAELCERYKEYGCKPFSGEVHAEDRNKTIIDFQSDAQASCKILVAVPAAGGVGITLTAAQTAIYIDKTWNAEHWMQSVDRLHRIGQKGAVNIISLNACKIDEIISYSLYRKQRNQAKLFGELRADEAQEEETYLPSREQLIAAVKD